MNITPNPLAVAINHARRFLDIRDRVLAERAEAERLRLQRLQLIEESRVLKNTAAMLKTMPSQQPMA